MAYRRFDTSQDSKRTDQSIKVSGVHFIFRGRVAQNHWPFARAGCTRKWDTRRPFDPARIGMIWKNNSDGSIIPIVYPPTIINHPYTWVIYPYAYYTPMDLHLGYKSTGTGTTTHNSGSPLDRIATGRSTASVKSRRVASPSTCSDCDWRCKIEALWRVLKDPESWESV